jgi:hypothetical protein
MDAEVARKRVEKAMGPAALKQEIDKVLKKIKVACDMGNSYVYVSNIGNTANEYIAICNYLKSLGYEVIKKNGSTCIEWSKELPIKASKEYEREYNA